MTRLGSSNLFYKSGTGVEAWGGERYLAFVAGSSVPSQGTAANENDFPCYTSRYQYSLLSSNRYYTFFLNNPYSASLTGIGITGVNNKSLEESANATNTINLTTDGSDTKDGGYLEINGKAFNGPSALTDTSDLTTDNNLHDPNFYGPVGTSVQLVAHPADGYAFAGYYDSANTTMITSNPSYTYKAIAQTQTVYARFVSTNCFYVSSAGADDSRKGFTDNIWTARDIDGKMTDNGSGSYSISFTNQSMGWRRFKVNGYYGPSTATGSWGGSNVTYGTDADTVACIGNTSTENSGNAKLYLKRKCDVTITYNSSTHAITVTAVPSADAVTYEYYIVGQASDGTAGMFGNVWADDWTDFSDEDKMNLTENTTCTYTLEKTNFGGTTGTYTYEAVRVGSDGSIEYYPGNSTTQTVDITDKAKKVTFTLTFSNSTFTGLSTNVINGDSKYDEIFVDANKNNDKKLFHDTNGSQAASWSNTDLQA